MAKLKKLKRSGEHKAFSEIEQLYVRRKEALEFLFAAQSFGCSENEIKIKKEHLDYQLQEAEYDASLALLGAIEAAFRLDFDDRHHKRLKDPRSKAVREMSKLPRGDALNYRIPITCIFNLLTIDHSAPERTINLLKIYFKFRHWLAHGRYWQLHLGINRPTFSEIFHVAQKVQSVLQS